PQTLAPLRLARAPSWNQTAAQFVLVCSGRAHSQAGVAAHAGAGMGFSGMNLRLRLFLLAIIAAAPGVALLAWNQVDLGRARTQQVEQEVTALARQQAAEFDRIAEGALQFLVALAQIPEIRTGHDGCGDLLARIRNNYLSYGALLRADLNGNVTC